MVKLFCDRCGREIEEGYYYTVNINKTEIRSKSAITELAEAMTSYTRKSPYEELNSHKMYCYKCKDDIERLVNRA